MKLVKIPLSNRYSYKAGQMGQKDWNQIIHFFSDATPYQTWSYGQVRWGSENLNHLVLYDNDVPSAAAQIRLVQLPGLRRGIAYISCGPMVCRKNAINAQQAASLKWILKALYKEYVVNQKLYLRVIPYKVIKTPDKLTPIFLQEKFRQNINSNKYRTLLVDLSLSTDELLMNLQKKWRKNLRRAQRKSLSTKEGTGTDFYKKFKQLYHEMHSRKKFTEHLNINDFEKIQLDLPDDLKYKILLAYHENELASAMVWSEIGDIGIIAFSATGNLGLKLNSSYLLRWIMLEKMKKRGLLQLDQGGINPIDNPNGYHYKKGFGGKEVEHVGTFWACENLLSYLLVNITEFSKKTFQIINKKICRA